MARKAQSKPSFWERAHSLAGQNGPGGVRPTTPLTLPAKAAKTAAVPKKKVRYPRP